jgi:hypothetical protein
MCVCRCVGMRGSMCVCLCMWFVASEITEVFSYNTELNTNNSFDPCTSVHAQCSLSISSTVLIVSARCCKFKIRVFLSTEHIDWFRITF